MHDKIKETTKENNDIISLSNEDLNQNKPKHTLAQRCKECNAIPLSKFEAEWMRQLELRFKNKGNKS